MKKEVSKGQAIILLIILIAIGGLVLYGENSINNSTLHTQMEPFDYVFK